MLFINQNTILCDIVEDNPNLIPVLARFGIRLGLGDKSVKQICNEYNINDDFFIVMVNTYMNEHYFPESKVKSFNINDILLYLERSNSYYLGAMLPNIESHLNAFINTSKNQNEKVESIIKLFENFKKRLSAQIDEDSYFFPQFRLIASKESEMASFDINSYKEDNEDFVMLLHEIKHIMTKYLKGAFNDNLCHAVLFSLHSLEKDMVQNLRIRNRILFPVVSNFRLVK